MALTKTNLNPNDNTPPNEAEQPSNESSAKESNNIQSNPENSLEARTTAMTKGLSEEEAQLFKIYSQENAPAKAGIPEIRVIYDEDDGIKGNFMVIEYEPDENGQPKKIKRDIGEEIDITILRTRFKYGYYDQDQNTELYGTPELDSFQDSVELWNNVEQKVIFSGVYKEFKEYIKNNFPDAQLEAKGFSGSIIKYTEILYVEYEGKIHRMYLSNTARNEYWAYKETIQGLPTFAYKTRLSTTKEKSGANIYFIVHFTQAEENVASDYIKKRALLDKDLKIFDEVRNQNREVDENTVKGGNPEGRVIAKYKLEFPKDFVRPVCPKCGEKMNLKDSFKGPFFGCSNFPNCKEIISLDTLGLGEKKELPTINVEESKNIPESEVLEKEPVVEDEINIDEVPF